MKNSSITLPIASSLGDAFQEVIAYISKRKTLHKPPATENSSRKKMNQPIESKTASTPPFGIFFKIGFTVSCTIRLPFKPLMHWKEASVGT